MYIEYEIFSDNTAIEILYKSSLKAFFSPKESVLSKLLQMGYLKKSAFVMK